MGAITAIFHRNDTAVDVRRQLDMMLAASAHRAVDGQAAWCEPGIGLGYQHFWLTPEEVGDVQPLCDESGRWTLVCDARLDNRAELAVQLGIDGGQLRGLSDATLLLQSYLRWGKECLIRLLGDFAFVVWDRQERVLFAARDPLGARDACYFVNPNLCLVASEVEQILAHPAVARKLSESRIAAYVALLQTEQAESFFEGVYYLPPGHAMLVGPAGMEQWRYWDLDPGRRIRYRDEREYGLHFRSLLAQAVQDRLRVTSRVGVALSGGLDSTSIAALAAQTLAPDCLHSCTYVFDELQSCDERRYVEPFLERYPIPATQFPADGMWPLRDLPNWPVFPDYIWTNATLWPMYALIDVARASECRVLLSGDYGDDLFLGGRIWAAEALADGRIGDVVRSWRRAGSGVRLRRDLWRRGVVQWLPATLSDGYRRRRPRSVSELNPGLTPEFAARTRIEERYRSDPKRSKIRSRGRLRRYRTLLNATRPQGLAHLRRLTHARGLELVMPYYDRRLVEFVMAIPADQLSRPGDSKRVLRMAMWDDLPAPIRERRGKTSYTPLFVRGLFEREWAQVVTLLSDAEIVRRGYARADWVREQLAQGASCGDLGNMLWLWLSLELWLRRYW